MHATPYLEPLPPAIPDRHPTLVDIHAAAAILGITPAVLATMINEGLLTRIRVGRATRFRLADVDVLHQRLHGVARSWGSA